MVNFVTIKLLNTGTVNYCNHPKIEQFFFSEQGMHIKDADGMANIVNPDLTAPSGAVRSRFTMFPCSYLTQLEFLRYKKCCQAV